MAEIVTTFTCSQTCQEPDTQNPGALLHTAELSPVPGDPKNDQIYAYTPLGNLRFISLKDGSFFEPGKLFEVKITQL